MSYLGAEGLQLGSLWEPMVHCREGGLGVGSGVVASGLLRKHVFFFGGVRVYLKYI